MGDEQDQESTETESQWDGGSFLTGLVLGAALGAGLALLFAPAKGSKTRRILGRRARELRRGASRTWDSAREEARQVLREKKESLRERVTDGLERLGDRVAD